MWSSSFSNSESTRPKSTGRATETGNPTIFFSSVVLGATRDVLHDGFLIGFKIGKYVIQLVGKVDLVADRSHDVVVHDISHVVFKSLDNLFLLLLELILDLLAKQLSLFVDRVVRLLNRIDSQLLGVHDGLFILIELHF